jgi:hypothetical protein
MSYLRNEFAGEMHGVSGRFFNVISDHDNPNLIRNQKFMASRPWGEKNHTIRVTVRFDDECKNGHESFAITGDVTTNTGRDVMGGCIHEEIEKFFPELSHLIKWHLCSTDGPMHYLANTLYLAGNRDHRGLLKGEESMNPRLMEHFVRFGDSPIEHKASKRLKEFIESTIAEDGEFILDKVDHRIGDKNYSKYQFAGMDCKWHECPFDTEDKARQWLDAITSTKMTWTSRTNVFGEGKDRELDAARLTAIWPDATDDQLCADRQVLEGLLNDRLPGLIADFKQAMLDCGFLYPSQVEAVS